MVTQISSTSGVIYPESDGKPMADNTRQYLWIVLIKEGLELQFADREDVFVAADLLWYPVEGNNRVCTAPDVMVAIGRPKGDRGSYLQWQEGNIPPQVVFEIRSPSNRQTELDEKLVFYDRYGVEEYYLYDPDRNDFSGWQRQSSRLSVINPISSWVSPLLGIRFEPTATTLEIFRSNGDRFISFAEMAQQAEQERQRAEQERQRADAAEARAARLAEQLRAVGIDPDAP
ncbi:Uma2 family endonuclease [Microcoleus sp. FACHB-1515]|uniref:Uma2 family endonuclease n=1 Tax=Cyanophyceae TaxID=3028117 RepID=UPI00168974B3|nr:Uma2 family endonuclease [Microcoleus sp. FACHB-1515]MBD2092027.1 Uma2 family endonuclease [Microcoleus sp. FACHB-1515]